MEILSTKSIWDKTLHLFLSVLLICVDLNKEVFFSENERNLYLLYNKSNLAFEPVIIEARNIYELTG